MFWHDVEGSVVRFKYDRRRLTQYQDSDCYKKSKTDLEHYELCFW